MVKRFLFLGLALTVVISMSFPLATNSERPEKAILWTRYLGEGLGFGAPVVDSERIYVACPTKIICFVLDSGELLWEREFPTSTKRFYSEFISPHKKYALYGNSDGLTCLDKKSGEIKWVISQPLTSNTEIVGDVAYAAFENSVCKIDINSGKVLLKRDFEAKNDYSFVTVAGLNKLFITTIRGLKRMVSLTTGKVIWENDSLINLILDKPIISGKYVVVSGYFIKFERMMFLNVDTGNVEKSFFHNNAQIDASDSRVLASEFCYDTTTLEPLWESGGNSRFFDCFDSVFIYDFDEMIIVDWNGNKIYSKKRNNFYLENSDLVWLKPAASNGKYALLTQFGYLVCYQNKPDLISYSIGDDHIVAEGKKVFLEQKPFANDKGELMVEPRGFLEPLGWVSSHVDGWWKNKTSDVMSFHDYNRIIAITASADPKLLKTIRAEKILNCQKTPDGHLVLPLETMVEEFGLTMTKEGDKIKLSYKSQ